MVTRVKEGFGHNSTHISEFLIRGDTSRFDVVRHLVL